MIDLDTLTNRAACLLFTAALAAPAGAALRPDAGADGWCGTHDSLLEQTLAKHELYQRLSRDRPAGPAKSELAGSGGEVGREGNVAVFVDNDGIAIRDRNRVDLPPGFAMRYQFKKRQGGYLVKPGGTYSDSLGELLELTDDDSIEIELPFNVKVYGRRFSSLWVNSDGNVTFGEPDFASTARDLTRVLDGPPRIAPFFSDLNPELAPADGGVFALVGKKSIRITWVEVPEFSSEGLTSRRNTFQLTLAKNGKATFVYGELDTQEGIVGIAPGGGSPVHLLDYSEELPAPVRQGAIVENFADQVSVDEAAVAKAFLGRFADQYSHLVVFTDFPIVLVGSALTVAFELTVKNEIRGIGEPTYDFSAQFGSDGALEAYVMMGDIDKYGDDIEARSLINGVYSPVDVLMHEIGHRWLVKALFEKEGEIREDLLGRGKVHWSYCHDSGHSYLEGNHWQANGNGSYTSVEGDARYNPLDLYLMGLREPAEVPDSFVIVPCDGDRPPEFNQVISGEPIDFSIDDVIRALGPRRPAVEDAPKTFNIAVLLLAKAGETPSQATIAKVNAFRKALESRFAGTGGKARTRLKEK